MVANKLLVTNVGALKAKYAKKYPRVEEAISELIKTDAGRGITSKLIALDDARAMKRLGSRPVLDPASSSAARPLRTGRQRETVRRIGSASSLSSASSTAHPPGAQRSRRA